MESMTTAGLEADSATLEARRDWVGALRASAEALAVSPGDPRARRDVLRLLGRLGLVEEAVQGLIALGEVLVHGGLALPAIACARDAFELRPGNADVTRLLGDLHARIAGRPVAAVARVAPPTPPVPVPDADETGIRGLAEAGLVARALELVARPAPALPPSEPGHVPLFSDLSRDAFGALVVTMSLRRVPPGDVIVKERSPGTSIFIVVRGRVEISRRQGDASIPLATLGPGTLFGEMALITSQPRTATVRTLDPVEVFEIDQPHVEAVAATHRAITDELVQFARRRLLMNLLQTSPIFRPFPPNVRAEILREFVSRIVPAGERLITEGEDPRGLFLVASGEVHIQKVDEAGDRLVLAHLREGEVFGEIALVEDGKTTATVEATVPSVLMFLDRAKFRAVAGRFPEILAYLKTLSTDRLADLHRTLAATHEVVDADDLVLL